MPCWLLLAARTRCLVGPYPPLVGIYARLSRWELTPFREADVIDVDAFAPSPSPPLVSPVGSLACDTLVDYYPTWSTTTQAGG